MQVIKREGTIVDYDPEKIRIAIGKANNEVRKKEKDSSIIELTIHEGKNHQVKKMFETIGFKVLKLKREKLAFLNLSGLKPGEYRYLSIKEVKMLYSLK